MSVENANIDRFINELRHSMVVAELNYQIWWVYKEKNSRARYAGTMNRYSPFFQTGIHAHFVAYLVAIYRLHEKRRDTINIPRFLDMLEKTRCVKSHVIEAGQKLLAQSKPLWIKAGILRNEAFAHRADGNGVADVFEKAAVKPDQLVELNELTKKILNGLTSHWNKTAHAFDVDAGEAASRLLEDLRKLHSAL
jgi:hypothetical protein